VQSDVVSEEETTRPRGRPAKTSPDVVIRTALRIADNEGLAALSMRRLADELGVGPTTLYSHVANKADLVARLREEVLRPLEVNIRGDERWQDQIFAGLLGLYFAFREHPSGIDLIDASPRILVEPGHRQMLHRAVGLLSSAGFTEADAIDTLTALLVYITGVVSHEQVQLGRANALREQLTAAGTTGDPAEILAEAWCRPIPVDTVESGLRALIEAYGARYAHCVGGMNAGEAAQRTMIEGDSG